MYFLFILEVCAGEDFFISCDRAEAPAIHVINSGYSAYNASCDSKRDITNDERTITCRAMDFTLDTRDRYVILVACIANGSVT